MDVKLNLAICWALAVVERSNSKIYSEAGYWYKNTHNFCKKLLCCIKPYTPPVISVCLFSNFSHLHVLFQSTLQCPCFITSCLKLY